MAAIWNVISRFIFAQHAFVGRALALHALGLFFTGVGRAAKWEQLGARVMREQIERQVHADGSHIEQSTYYHLYATDMFLWHAILAKPDSDYMNKLEKMVDYLHAVMGPSRLLPFLGDDDGGRLFHPYGKRDRFGRATLATACAVLNRSDWQWEPKDLHEQAVWCSAPACWIASQGKESGNHGFFPMPASPRSRPVAIK